MILPWLEATNRYPFVYDKTWGGLIMDNGEVKDDLLVVVVVVVVVK